MIAPAPEHVPCASCLLLLPARGTALMTAPGRWYHLSCYRRPARSEWFRGLLPLLGRLVRPHC